MAIEIRPYGPDRYQVFDGDLLLATFGDLDQCKKHAQASEAKLKTMVGVDYGKLGSAAEGQAAEHRLGIHI